MPNPTPLIFWSLAQKLCQRLVSAPAAINPLHYPVDHVMLGTEFGWGQREDIDGNTGSDYRVQFSLKVDFDSGDLLRR